MQKDLGLTDSRRFAQLYQQGRGWANTVLVLKVLPNEMGKTRFGLVTSKKIGNAVIRNKVRRRLREILKRTPTESGWDLVFIARKGPTVSDYQQLRHATRDLLRRAKLLKPFPDQNGEQN